MLRVSDLRHKDVVNNIDGKRLGYIKDIELDLNEGRIKSIILPGENKLFSFFGHNDDLVIEWQNVKKIGLDVILVELETFSAVKNRSNLYEDENGYYERKEKKRRHKASEDEYDYRKHQEIFSINEDKKRYQKTNVNELDYRKPSETFSDSEEKNIYSNNKRMHKPNPENNSFQSYPKEKLDSYDWSKIRDWGEPKPWRNDYDMEEKDAQETKNPWLKPSIKNKI